MGHRASSISTHTPANINNKLSVFINDFSSTVLSLTTAPCRGRRTSTFSLSCRHKCISYSNSGNVDFCIRHEIHGARSIYGI